MIPTNGNQAKTNSPNPDQAAATQQVSASPIENTNGKIEQTKPVAKKRNHYLLLLTIIILVIGAVCFAYWYLYLRFYQSTDDAYVNGNYIVLNSVVSGSVVSFYADDTDLVEQGQLLVLLDRTNYAITYERELTVLAATVLEVRQLYDNVKVSQAALDNRKAVFERTEYDFKNRSNLIDSGAVSNEDFVHAKNDLMVAEYNLKQAQFQLQAAQAAAGNTAIEKHPLIEKQKANIASAFYNLQHCFIYAPYTGYIAKRTVDVGEWVTSQSSLMAIIPSTYVWVDANFKETQLTNMRIGQSATVWFDIYGSSVVYEGSVIGIASGTGSIFSLIPPQNATGNWIKIVQRLPVRISLDPELVKKYPLRLGLSANVDVNITNQDLPFLTQTTSSRPVAQTSIFDIQMEEVNQLMEKIVKENLNNQQDH